MGMKAQHIEDILDEFSGHDDYDWWNDEEAITAVVMSSYGYSLDDFNATLTAKQFADCLPDFGLEKKDAPWYLKNYAGGRNKISILELDFFFWDWSVD